MNIVEPLKLIRRRVQMARVKLDILCNALERRQRRLSARKFVSSPNPHLDTAVSSLSHSGCTPWSLDDRCQHSLGESWNSILTNRQLGAADHIDRSTGKTFFDESLSLSSLKTLPAFTSIALDESLLLVILRTLGMVPHLESVEVVVSNPVPSLSASQLWHRDVNDVRLLKLFVYLNDVEEAQGPFTYIPAHLSAHVRPSGEHYVNDQYIERFVPRAEWRRVTGPRGTSFIIDTGRCYHYGSRCIQPRVAYVATYSCGIRYMKYSRRWAELLGERAGNLSELQRASCGLS